MFLPHANAKLTKVAGGGFSEDGSAEATEGETKWSGRVDAYVVDELVDVTVGERLDQLQRTHVAIPGNLPREGDFEIELGDTLTYEMDGERYDDDHLPPSRTVEQIVPHRLLGVIRVYFRVG